MRDKSDRPTLGGKLSVYRHPATVRVTHWINAACILVLVLSGIQILNAHPSLYWGSQSNFHDAWLRFPANLPGWPMLPASRDLAAGRNWHFFFAWIFAINGFIYLTYGLWRRHFARDLTPTRTELAAIVDVAKEHAKFHFPHLRRYNVIQMLAYLGVIFVLAPLMVATGLTMSPGMDAAYPFLLDLFGGRQSARTIHFICASLIVGFVLVHVALVILAGFWNNLRSMITGRYVIEAEKPAEQKP